MNEPDMTFVVKPAPVASHAVSIKDEAPRQMAIENDAGKKAVIDFSGDAVTYSGDLPVAESARLFFDAVNPLFGSGRIT